MGDGTVNPGIKMWHLWAVAAGMILLPGSLAVLTWVLLR